MSTSDFDEGWRPMSEHDQKPAQITCAHCGRPIRRPPVGSYPPSVLWVHKRSPVGIGNRYCGINGDTATPRSYDESWRP